MNVVFILKVLTPLIFMKHVNTCSLPTTQKVFSQSISQFLFCSSGSKLEKICSSRGHFRMYGDIGQCVETFWSQPELAESASGVQWIKPGILPNMMLCTGWPLASKTKLFSVRHQLCRGWEALLYLISKTVLSQHIISHPLLPGKSHLLLWF